MLVLSSKCVVTAGSTTVDLIGKIARSCAENILPWFLFLWQTIVLTDSGTGI